MEKKRAGFICMISCCIVSCLFLVSCKKAEGMQDGYYTAEMAAYSHGWKEYVTICVMKDKIVSVEYNAKDPSGFIKSWDIAYMREMGAAQGTYPNKYTRAYAAQLIEDQGVGHIDMVTGASSSGGNFRRLAEAVIERAESGDTSVAVVETADIKE